MAAENIELKNLNTEWSNRDHESMAPLLHRLLELKREKTYEQALYDMATNAFPRTAKNAEYVAHLLYLLDERPYPVVALQRIIHIQQGHLYRTLERAGVEFDAAHSKGLYVHEDLFPWPGQVYIDLFTERVCMGGQSYDFNDPNCPVLVSFEFTEEAKVVHACHRDGGQPVTVPPPLPVRRHSEIAPWGKVR